MKLTFPLVPEFLYWGYLPSQSVLLPEVSRIVDRLQPGTLPRAGAFATAFMEAVDTLLARHGGGPHVVPLSGGYDSRLILAGLLNRLSASEISAVTFGVPGAPDYEMAQQVAERAGIEQVLVDLRQVTWDWGDLVEFASGLGRPVSVFESYLFHQVRLPFGKDACYWSGFGGDALAGSHLPRVPSTSWEQAVQAFQRGNRAAPAPELIPPGLEPLSSLPAEPPAPGSPLGLDDQLDLAVRQPCYIRPVVSRKGYIEAEPLLHPSWAVPMLSLPAVPAVRRRHHKGAIARLAPRLYEVPATANRGLPASAPRWRVQIKRLRRKALSVMKGLLGQPMLPPPNYVAFSEALRRQGPLQGVVYEAGQAVEARGLTPWVDVDQLWRMHQAGTADATNALLTLASAGILLQSSEGCQARGSGVDECV